MNLLLLPESSSRVWNLSPLLTTKNRPDLGAEIWHPCTQGLGRDFWSEKPSQKFETFLKNQLLHGIASIFSPKKNLTEPSASSNHQARGSVTMDVGPTKKWLDLMTFCWVENIKLKRYPSKLSDYCRCSSSWNSENVHCHVNLLENICFPWDFC